MNRFKLNLQFFAEEPQGDPASQEGEKTFTQDDVNRIVSERLAKEKAKYEAAAKTNFQEKEVELSRREQELTLREFKATARETLTNKNLPMELLDVINYSSEEEMNKSIDILEKAYGQGTRKPNIKQIYNPAGGENPMIDPIRAAFNLQK